MAGLLAVHPAAGQDVDPATRAAARTLAYSGVEAYQRGDFATASEKMEKAFAALPAPSVGLWSARALAKLGLLVEASERYRLVARLQPTGSEEDVQRKAQQDAAADLQALIPRIPSIVVELEATTGPGATVTIDGSPVPWSLLGEKRPVDPGQHQIVARRGAESAERTVTVREGEHLRVVLNLSSTPQQLQTSAAVSGPQPPSYASRPAAAPDARAPGSDQRTAGWITLAVGGAALSVGAVTGLVALGKKSSLDSNPACSDNRCAPSEQSAADSYNSLRSVSMAGFIAGGLICAAGGVILLTVPKTEQAVSVRVSPGAVSVGGAF